MRLCRKLTFRMFELLNPSEPLALLEKLSVQDFLKDKQLKDGISSQFIKSAVRSDRSEVVAKRLNDEVIPAKNKKIKALQKQLQRVGDKLQQVESHPVTKFSDYNDDIKSLRYDAGM